MVFLSMTNSDFLQMADITLEYFYSYLEDIDVNTVLDIEYSDYILNIQLLDERVYVLNRHLAMEELWLSSPVEGPSHFALIADNSSNQKKFLWKDKQGREIGEVFAQDLTKTTGIELFFDNKFYSII